METDLAALKFRLSRLEALVGETPSKINLMKDLTVLQKELRRSVPDEMAAAFKTVALLSSVGTLPATRAARMQQLSFLEKTLEQSEDHVIEFDGLKHVLDEPLDMEQLHPEALAALENRVYNVSSDVLEEERNVDAVLIEFNRVTERLNNAILHTAKVLQSQSSSTQKQT
ncbi:unnamed protein product [Agarophyton chilense]